MKILSPMSDTTKATLAYIATALLLFLFAALCGMFTGCASVEAVQRRADVSLAIYTKPDSICGAVHVGYDSTLTVGYGPVCVAWSDLFRRGTIVAPLDTAMLDTGTVDTTGTGR
jgi:hypothetical protein